MKSVPVKFDYNFIIEKMRRKHSKYRDLKKPTLRSLKHNKSPIDICFPNFLKMTDYRRVQEHLPTRLRIDLLKCDIISVRAIRQLQIPHESEETNHSMVCNAVQFNE
jgi:hypothetical protein